MNKAASQWDSATCKYYKSSWIVMARGKRVFVMQRLKDMGFKPVQNVIRTSKSQNKRITSDWHFIFVINLGRDNSTMEKCQLLLDFLNCKALQWALAQLCRNFLFSFPPPFFRHFSLLWLKSQILSFLSPSFWMIHSFHWKCKVVHYEAAIVLKHLLMWGNFQLLVARFACRMNNESKSQE